MRRSHGSTLTELAVVMMILSLLLATGMMTLTAQTEARNNEEAARRVNAAVDALVGFAITNRRLPCPASANTTGDEDPIAGTGSCTSWYGGFLPAKTIGLQPTDTSGYAVDPWGNRLRYVVANLITGCTGILDHAALHLRSQSQGEWCQLPAERPRPLPELDGHQCHLVQHGDPRRERADHRVHRVLDWKEWRHRGDLRTRRDRQHRRRPRVRHAHGRHQRNRRRAPSTT